MPKLFKNYIIFGTIVIIILSIVNLSFLWLGVIFLITIALGLYDIKQTKHSLWRNFPIVGRMRWVLEELRPPFRQYFIESDIDGVPISRQMRTVVYRRSKKLAGTIPFGTKIDVYKAGYEWIGHSLKALKAHDLEQSPRVTIGGIDCKKPYSASILNVSAMSFGALSANAVMSLGHGAKIGNFALNTGEGGLSRYHLNTACDLIWQVGTGYFGCRNDDGTFNEEKFAEKSKTQNVKMIEIKLSQGAKPGHGGILPAYKNTAEIAEIRGVKANTRVDSPPTHSAFSSVEGLLKFVKKLRDLSDGKPIGFKLCIGRKEEFIEICKAMIELDIKPDFISVDGGEGGTGAAPLEYTNSVGMPLREALVFVVDSLRGFDLKDDIKIIASGKVLNGMHITKALALGADLCASARGMMLSLGCIQALQCHKNTCPTGVATQDARFTKGLVVEDKKQRVANFHSGTVESFVEILASAGLDDYSKLNRTHIFRRLDQTSYKRYDELFSPMRKGDLLNSPYPEDFERFMK
ncbi:FMN-binding glutamate synthase family protein [Arcobacter sp. LA11]|uniref:FMN-binding glutamate synthase family protein n=1 Tax=Arcobacter sp. LA11 TaxID=1898176 RepID=UPI00093262A1|nr:FMN-binding glutamate synthase family protein [Arcobacter sp. LA11]